MGRFADVIWRDGSWKSTEPERPEVTDDGTSQLGISIYDSDIATISFAGPAGVKGLFYLGVEPAEYFESPDESLLVDHKREAKAFARWVQETTGRSIKARSVLELMAVPGRDPGDSIVEADVAKLLNLAGLEKPDWYW